MWRKKSSKPFFHSIFSKFTSKWSNKKKNFQVAYRQHSKNKVFVYDINNKTRHSNLGLIVEPMFFTVGLLWVFLIRRKTGNIFKVWYLKDLNTAHIWIVVRNTAPSLLFSLHLFPPWLGVSKLLYWLNYWHNLVNKWY